MANAEHLKMLHMGVLKWNAWRESEPTVKPDLSGLDFAPINLSKANLTDVNFAGANLSKAKLRGANLRGAKLTRVNFAGANFSMVSLAGANYEGASFAGADITGANFAERAITEADIIGMKTNRCMHGRVRGKCECSLVIFLEEVLADEKERRSKQIEKIWMYLLLFLLFILGCIFPPMMIVFFIMYVKVAPRNPPCALADLTVEDIIKRHRDR